MPPRSSPGPASVFAYGTLMPGRSRWPLVADLVTTRLADEVPGLLYDTGDGYPALVAPTPAPGPFRAPLVEGVVLGLDRDRLDAALDRFDRIEGTDRGLYRRVVVVTVSGTETYTYLWAGSVDGLTGLPGRWVGPGR